MISSNYNTLMAQGGGAMAMYFQTTKSLENMVRVGRTICNLSNHVAMRFIVGSMGAESWRDQRPDTPHVATSY